MLLFSGSSACFDFHSRHRKHKNLLEVKTNIDISRRLILLLMPALMAYAFAWAVKLPLMLMFMLMSLVKTSLNHSGQMKAIKLYFHE